MRAKDTYLRVSILSLVVGEIQYLSQRRSPEREEDLGLTRGKVSVRKSLSRSGH